LNAARDELERSRRGYEEITNALENYRTNLSHFSIEEADADIKFGPRTSG
jgi:hypothetical protein